MQTNTRGYRRSTLSFGLSPRGDREGARGCEKTREEANRLFPVFLHGCVAGMPARARVRMDAHLSSQISHPARLDLPRMQTCTTTNPCPEIPEPGCNTLLYCKVVDSYLHIANLTAPTTSVCKAASILLATLLRGKGTDVSYCAVQTLATARYKRWLLRGTNIGYCAVSMPLGDRTCKPA